MQEDDFLKLIINPDEVDYSKYERLIPVELIRPRYYYNYWYRIDSNTGLLVMKRRHDSKITHSLFDLDDFNKISSKAWYPHRDGSKPDSLVYVYTSESIKLHRIIMNCPPEMCVDHINRLPLDNRKTNMKICTIAENNKNVSMNKRNTSGVRGVKFDTLRKQWIAHRYVNGKLCSKRCKSFEEACECRRLYEEIE